MFKRIMSLLLAAVMVMSMLPMEVFAEEGAGEETIPETSAAAITEETQPEATEEITALPGETQGTTAPTEAETEPSEETAVTESPEETTAPATEPEEETTATESAEETESTESTVETVVEETQGEASQPAAAAVIASGDCGDNATWSLDSDGTVTISGTGPLWDCESCPWMYYQEDVLYAVIESGITKIGWYMFFGCESLRSVTIPDTVKELAYSSFGYCTSLTSFTIPAGVTNMGEGVFDRCSSLKEIKVASGNTSFVCDSQGVLYNKNKTRLIKAPVTLSGTYTIPDSVTEIDLAAFNNCRDLESVSIPKSVKTVNGFRECRGLENITIPNGATEIARYAFTDAVSLTKVVIPDSVKSIGYSAFSGCIRLTDITLPNGITSLDNTFSYCTALKKIVIPDSVTSLSSTFSGCTRLAEITIPDSVTSISGWIFSDCTSLTEITIPDRVKSIDSNAFYGCTGLSIVTIGKNVTEISGYAFDGCTNLQMVFFRGNVPECTSYGGVSQIFDGISPTIYYPGDNATWTEAIRAEFGKGILWVPYEVQDDAHQQPDHIIKEIEVKRNAHTIVVADADSFSNELWPIEGAKVTIGGHSYTTDENGMVFFREYNGKRQEVTVSAEGYKIREMTYVQTKEEAKIFFMERLEEENSPYITMITGRADGMYVDLRDSALHFTEGSTEKLGFYLKGNWAGKESAGFTIYQEATAEHDGVSLWVKGDAYWEIEPGTHFYPEEQIKISMNAWEPVYENGVQTGSKSVPVDVVDVHIMIDKKREQQGGGTQVETETILEEGVTTFDWIGEHPVESDDDIFTKLLTEDYSLKSELIPAEIAKEYNSDGTYTYKVIIGLVAGEQTKNILYSKSREKAGIEVPAEESWEAWKNLIAGYKKATNPTEYFKAKKQKYLKSLRPSKLNCAREVEGQVAGYAEITKNQNGEIIRSEGGLIIEFKGYHTVGKTFFAGPVPLYYEFKPGVEVSVEGGIKIVDNGGELHFGPYFAGAKLALPAITLEGGAGVRGVTTLGLQGNGKLETAIETPKSTTGTLYLDGGIHIKILFVVDYTWEFASQELRLWPKTDTKSRAAYARMTDGNGELSLVSRAYLDNRSSWNGSVSSARSRSIGSETLATLQTGVMPEAMPKLHQVGDKLILLMLQDDPERTTGNNTQLVYSVLENGTWSEPAAVMPSDTADYFFDSRVENGQLYVTWQKAAKPMEEIDADALLDEVTANSEICVARWDNTAGAFTGQKFITSNQTLDMMPQIAGTANGISVIWVSNDANNAMGSAGTYSIHRATAGGTVSDPVTLLDTSEYVMELCANTAASGTEFMYIALTEDNSTKLYLVKNGSKTEVQTTGIPAGLEYDGKRFLWNENGTIRTYASGRFGELVCENSSASYRCITNSERTAMVWLDSNESGARIEASFYEDSTWCAPVTLLEGIPGTITYYDATLLEDGEVALILNNAEYSQSGPEDTALLYAVVPPKTDLALQAVTAEKPDWEAGTQEIMMCVENPGARKITEANLTVAAGEEILLDTVVSLNLLPGEDKVLTQTVDISGLTALAETEVVLRTAEDDTPENDVQTVSLGQVDVGLDFDVYHRDEQLLFVFSASNESTIPANVTLQICENSLDGPVVGTLDMGLISNEKLVQHTYAINTSDISYDAGGLKHYFFRLSMDETDWNEYDNYAQYTLTRMPETEPDPSGETVEIELINPTSVQIQPGELTFSDTQADSVQLQAWVSPENATVKHVEWSVENADIVHITSGGKVTPLRPGTTTITATVIEGVSATIRVSVLNEAHVHTESVRPAIPPTCTENGLTEGRVCATCGEVLVVQDVIPAMGHSFVKQEHGVICSLCCSRISLNMPQEYIALVVNQSTQLTIEAEPGELLHTVQWTVDSGNDTEAENGKVIEVDSEGHVTAIGEGTAYVTATLTSGGIVLTDRCRVDVSPEPEVTGIQLSTQTLTSELYSTEYARFEILLQLPQNEPKEADPAAAAAEAAMAFAGAEDPSPAIESVQFLNEAMEELFELRLLDDRHVSVVPTQTAVDMAREDPGSIQKSYTAMLMVRVQGKEFQSESLTLTVKKSVPKLKATISGFNSFYTGQSQQIIVTGGTPVKIYPDASRNTGKTTALPEWLALEENGTATLKPDAPAKNISGKAYLLIDTEEWRIPAAVTLVVRNTYKVPGMKLSTSSVTVTSDANASDGIALKLLCTNKANTLAGLKVAGMTAPEGYSIEKFDLNDGSFVLKPQEGFVPGKIGLNVHFDDTNTVLSLPLTVKTAKVTLKLSARSVTLNRALNDSTALKVTATPTDYRIVDPVIRLTATEKINGRNTTVDKTDSGVLDIAYENGILRIATTDLTPDTASYKLCLSAGDSKEATVTVKVISAVPTLSLKATGTMDLSFPTQAAQITASFHNYSGPITAFDYEVRQLKGRTVINGNVKDLFRIEREEKLFRMFWTDREKIDPACSYELKLKLTLANDEVIEKTISLKIRQTAVKLKLSASKLSLNKDQKDVAAVAVACITKGYNFTEPMLSYDAGKLDVTYDAGTLHIGLQPESEYGKTYPIEVRAHEGAPAVKLNVAVLKKDVAVKSTIKATGTLDVIRGGTAITVRPAYTNVLNVDVDSAAVLKIYSSADKYKDVFAELRAENGVFIIDGSVIKDHTLKYKAELETVIGEKTVVSSRISLNVKMGAARLTVRSSGTTLFARDRNDRALVWFEAADGTLNDVSGIAFKNAKQADLFEIIDYGNGGYAIGFRDSNINPSLVGKAASKAVTVTLNVFIEGNRSPKANTTANVKLTVVK